MPMCESSGWRFRDNLSAAATVIPQKAGNQRSESRRVRRAAVMMLKVEG